MSSVVEGGYVRDRPISRCTGVFFIDGPREPMPPPLFVSATPGRRVDRLR